VNSSRILPILNACGCLILCGLVILLWRKEHRSQNELTKVRQQWLDSQEAVAEETLRASHLERDLATLKESLENTQKAATEHARILDEQSNHNQNIEGQLQTALAQLKTWEQAIADRDAKLLSLHDELKATRQRLDIAISRINAAGVRAKNP
jgi:uncharacterized phage infection (PIP) family protein YhgE